MRNGKSGEPSGAYSGIKANRDLWASQAILSLKSTVFLWKSVLDIHDNMQVCAYRL